MPVKLPRGDVYGRLDQLEAIVFCGQPFNRFDCKLFKRNVAVREGCVTRTVDRKVKAGDLPPPTASTAIGHFGGCRR